MGRLQETFAALAAAKKKAFIGYAMAGFPSEGADLELARAVLEASDILELGVPFSDPIADGPVLQRCSEKALHAGGGLGRALELARALRAGSGKPLLLMSYLNPLLAMGLETFAHAAKAAGVDGLVIPDLPPEEAAGLSPAIKGAGLDLVYLAAPTSTPARLKAIAKAATVAELRKSAKVPLAIGFGISSPEGAREAAGLSDGVVVASTVLKAVLDAPAEEEGLSQARARVRELSAAVRAA